MLKKKARFIGAALFIITIIFLIPFTINIIFFPPYNINTLLASTSLYVIIIGLFFIKRAKKFNVQLLKYAGFFLITGFVVSASSFFLDILNYIFTTSSIEFQYMEIGAVYLEIISSAMWYPIAVSFAMYIGAELLIPNIKKYFMSILIILLIASEILLYIYPLFFLEDILADPVGFGIQISNIQILEFYVFVFIYLGVNGFGFLYKSIQTKGTLRTKIFLLSIAFFVDILHFFGLGDPILNLIIAIVQPPLFYLGLKQKKPKKVKKEKTKIPSKRSIELASYLLRKNALIDKMDDIEEQINSTLGKELTLFISYATNDSDLYRIKEVAKILGTYKYIKKVLFWEKDMDDNIITYMNENLGKCDVMILFCSKNTLNSVPVQKEWTAAEIMGKPIIPVFYDINDIPPLLKSRLGVEFNFYSIQENARNLYNLTLKKYFSL